MTTSYEKVVKLSLRYHVEGKPKSNNFDGHWSLGSLPVIWPHISAFLVPFPLLWREN